MLKEKTGDFIVLSVRLIGICVLLLLLVVTLELYSNGYSNLIGSILKKNVGTYYLDQFDVLYFTYHRYVQLRMVLILLSILAFIANVYLWTGGKKMRSVLGGLFNEIINLFKNYGKTFKDLTGNEKLITFICFLLILVSRVYLFRRYPFNGDEACSYFAFVKNGFLYTLSYYPTPNNHILFNLICIPFSYIFSDPLLTMRLPNVVINFFLLAFIFLSLIRKTNFNTALLAVILTGLSFSCSIYAVHGRGYMLMSFLTILAIFSFFKLLNGEVKRVYNFIFISSCILGGFTIPVFILPCLSLLVYGLLISYKERNYKLGRSVLISSVVIVAGVISLYLPVILISGLDAIINNEFVQPFTDMRSYFFYIIPVASVEAIDYILGTLRSGYVFLMMFLLLFIIAFKKTEEQFKKRWYVFMILSIGCTYFVFIVQRNFAEFRMITFYGFLFFITLSLVMIFFIDYIQSEVYKKVCIFTIGIFFILLIPFTFDRKMNIFYGSDYLVSYNNMDQMIRYIDSKNPQNIFVRDKAFTLFLQYHNAISQGKKVFLQINGKSNHRNYDFVILEREEDFPTVLIKKDYKKIENPFHTFIYQKI